MSTWSGSGINGADMSDLCILTGGGSARSQNDCPRHGYEVEEYFWILCCPLISRSQVSSVVSARLKYSKQEICAIYVAISQLVSRSCVSEHKYQFGGVAKPNVMEEPPPSSRKPTRAFFVHASINIVYVKRFRRPKRFFRFRRTNLSIVWARF